MGRKIKTTENILVAEWLIEHKWLNSLNIDTKQKMPAFVDDAVMGAIYIVAGSSNGKVNVSPKLVFKCLMLPNITANQVKRMEVGYAMSDRHARRLAQTVRFALGSIKHKVQENEYGLSIEQEEMVEMERQFIRDYYSGKESPLYSPNLKPLPSEISQLRLDGKYLEYGFAVSVFRSKQ